MPLASPTPAPLDIRISAELPAGEGEDVPSRIVAEAIGLDAPVIEMDWQVKKQGSQLVSEWNVPDDGAGWHRNSAQPGQGDNVVISGHNNSSGGRVFAQLEELSVGDPITLWSHRGAAFVYEVKTKELIRTFAASQEAAAYLQQVMGPAAQEQLTLITCWPSWSNTHRLIIIAKPL